MKPRPRVIDFHSDPFPRFHISPLTQPEPSLEDAEQFFSHLFYHSITQHSYVLQLL